MKRNRFNTVTRTINSEAHVKRTSFSEYAGKHGTVVQHRINDNGLASYKVRFADGKELWWTENELTRER